VSQDGYSERRQQGREISPSSELPRRINPGQAIGRMNEGEMLAPEAYEQRRLIHARQQDHRQIDRVRELRTNVLTRTSHPNPVVMVTGVGARCGVSYVARNLAASIALDEERTALLIDCNLRRPSLALDFSLAPDAPGLIDVFGGRETNLAGVIHSTGVPRLRLIPAGQGGGRWIEFFASLRMRALMLELRDRYDDRFVVLDAPPVLGSPDARMLAEHADLVILVVGEASHRAETIRRAAAALPPERLAGVVFNHLP
jgi:protein-tyrosine kinase